MSSQPFQAKLTSCTDPVQDRKSTRLNSSHSQISYAVFCLKKKNESSGLTARGRPVKRHREPLPNHAALRCPFYRLDPTQRPESLYVPVPMHDHHSPASHTV